MGSLAPAGATCVNSCFEGPNLTVLIGIATALTGTIAFLFRAYDASQKAAFAAYQEVQEARVRELWELARSGNALARRATETTATLAETERGHRP